MSWLEWLLCGYEASRAEIKEKIERLKEIKLDLTKKLDDYEGMTETRWDIVKESFEEFLVRVSKAWQVSYKKASTAFKK